MNNTTTSIYRNDTSYVNAKGSTTIYPCVVLDMTRKIGNKRVRINRRFQASKFNNSVTLARAEAERLASEAVNWPDKRFEQVRRPIGRSRKSHYFIETSI